jgi:hypothetical protein
VLVPGVSRGPWPGQDASRGECGVVIVGNSAANKTKLTESGHTFESTFDQYRILSYNVFLARCFYIEMPCLSFLLWVPEHGS